MQKAIVAINPYQMEYLWKNRLYARFVFVAYLSTINSKWVRLS